MSDNPELNYRINLREGDKGAEKALERYNKALAESQRLFRADSSAKVQRELNQLRERGVQVLEREEQRQRQITAELQKQAAFDRTRTAGDLSSGLGATRTLASTLGAGTGLTGGLEVGDDFFQFVEYLPRLRESMGALSSAAVAAAGGIGPLVLSLGAVGIALVGVGAAFDAFQRSQQEQARQLEATISARIDIAKALADGLTAEEARAAKERLEITSTFLRSELDLLQRLYDQGLEQARQVAGAAGEAAFRASAQEEELANSIDNLRKEIEGVEAQTNQYTRVLNNNLTATNDAAAAEERITEARKKTLDVIKQLEAQQQALITSYERQQKALAESRDLQDSRRAEDEELRAARQSADLARQLAQEQQAQQRRLLAIAQQGSQALAAVQKATLERERATVQQIAKLRDTANRDALRAEQRYQLERRRAAEDLAFEEFESAIENDISRVLVARSRFNRDEGRASEDFNIEQREREEALALRIAEINAELAEFRQAQNEKRAEIQAQTKAELEAARAEFEEKQRLDQESRELARQREEEDRALTRSRQEEDRRLEDQRGAEQLSRQLADIETKRIAEVRALGDVISATGQVRRAAGEIAALLSGRSNTPFNRQITSGAGLTSRPAASFPMSVAPQSMSLMSTSSSASMPSPLSLPGGNGVTVNVTGNAFGNVATTETIMGLVGAIKGAFVNGRLGA